MRRLVSFGLLVALATSGCSFSIDLRRDDGGRSEPGQVIVETTVVANQGATGATLRLRCGPAEVDLDPADPNLTLGPLDEAVSRAFDEATAMFSKDFFRNYRWSVTERTPSGITFLGTSTSSIESVGHAYAAISYDGATWVAGDHDPCDLTLNAPGFGPAAWVIDPDTQPDPDANNLVVLINEVGCANGQPPIGRSVLSVVVQDDHSAIVFLLVQPVAGAADCQSNPWSGTNVSIGHAVGDRLFFDGSAIPPLPRPWPPTKSSIDSLGRER